MASIKDIVTKECSSIETRYGSAINVEMKVGLSPLHNKVYGDVVCKESGRRRAKQELPAAYCPNGLPGYRTAVVEFIKGICKPIPAENNGDMDLFAHAEQ